MNKKKSNATGIVFDRRKVVVLLKKRSEIQLNLDIFKQIKIGNDTTKLLKKS